MLKKFYIPCAAMLVMAFFCGCLPSEFLRGFQRGFEGAFRDNPEESYDDYGSYGFDEYDRLTAPEIWHNGYLGLTVTVPAGWYKTYQNEINLTETPGESDRFESLDLYDYEDGSYQIELVDIESESDSSYGDHAMISLTADYYPDYTYDEYLDEFPYWIDLSGDDYTYTLIEAGEQQINGQRFDRFMLLVTSEDAAPFYEEYYVAPVADCFFVVYINYWGDSKKSREDAYAILKGCFALDAVGNGGVAI